MPDLSSTLTEAWGDELEPIICENCDWQFLRPIGHLSPYCPYCYEETLVPLTEESDLSLSHTPELIIPFAVPSPRLDQTIQQFAETIRFAPSDLTVKNLQARMKQVYLPVWLVDSDVEATWQAEVGFNYDTVTHEDRFDENRGGWVSRQKTDTRIRWEPRVGQLQRHYHNIPAPALDEHQRVQRQLGAYDYKQASAYEPKIATQSFIRLPNRLPEDAWPEALPEFQVKATEECRRACQVAHIRKFRWQADFQNQHWTFLLMPLYSTFYLDDEQTPRPVLIHGQTGRINGHRQASIIRARQMTYIIEALAAVIFTVSVILMLIGLAFPPLIVVGIIGLIIGLVISALGLIPIFMAWQFNQNQQPSNS